MIDVFQECRERVTAQEAAQFYGLTFDRRGVALCPFHDDRHPSMSFKGGRFRCWACQASGDSIDFTMHYLGLSSPLEAVKRLNEDFHLSLPLHGKPTATERVAARKRQELAELHRAFEAWRRDFICDLNRCILVANLALKRDPVFLFKTH